MNWRRIKYDSNRLEVEPKIIDDRKLIESEYKKVTK